MPTSFHVNAHDLQFILKQIAVAELQAETPGMTTVRRSKRSMVSVRPMRP